MCLWTLISFCQPALGRSRGTLLLVISAILLCPPAIGSRDLPLRPLPAPWDHRHICACVTRLLKHGPTLISKVSILTLGNDNSGANFKGIFHLQEAKIFSKQQHQGYICLKNFSRRGSPFVHFMFPFTFRSIFLLSSSVFCVSSCCVTPFPLPRKCWVPYRPVSHNWECIQRPLVQEVGSNPKKPWTSKFENTLWMAFSYRRFQVEFVFGLKEFIQVFTNIQLSELAGMWKPPSHNQLL